MKILFFVFLFLTTGTMVMAQKAQSNISGLWYSSDSSRIYKVYPTSYGYEANLYSSKRRDDQKGIMILKDVKFNSNKNDFIGWIYSSDGIESTEAKIKVEANQKILLLKLPRLLFFPVYIKWYRAQ